MLGVAGGTCSGKTKLADRLAELMGDDELALIKLDSYYWGRDGEPFEQRALVNYDHPDAFDWPLLVDTSTGCAPARRCPCRSTTTPSTTVRARCAIVSRRSIVVIEGILVLYEPTLRERFDLKVYVDTDADVRLIRRLRRDVAERGRTPESIMTQYMETVRPSHLQFIEPSKRHADVIVPRAGSTALRWRCCSRARARSWPTDPLGCPRLTPNVCRRSHRRERQAQRCRTQWAGRCPAWAITGRCAPAGRRGRPASSRCCSWNGSSATRSSVSRPTCSAGSTRCRTWIVGTSSSVPPGNRRPPISAGAASSPAGRTAEDAPDHLVAARVEPAEQVGRKTDERVAEDPFEDQQGDEAGQDATTIRSTSTGDRATRGIVGSIASDTIAPFSLLRCDRRHTLGVSRRCARADQ